MIPYRFYKEPDGRWYIDLPEYMEQGGDKADLEMVEGADTFLDLIAQGKTNVYALLDEKPFEQSEQLFRSNREVFSGSYYRLERYGSTLGQELEAAGLPIEEGALYPLLRRLEAQGLLTSEWREEGRNKRFYRLSGDGERVLAQLLSEWNAISKSIVRLSEGKE